MFVDQVNGREADGGRGVASRRLGKNVRRAELSGNSRLTAEDCWVLVTTQTFRGGKSGERRARVSRSMVWSPTILRSCFGVRVRLRGQKRVPRPPASKTAQAGSWLSLVLAFARGFIESYM